MRVLIEGRRRRRGRRDGQVSELLNQLRVLVEDAPHLVLHHQDRPQGFPDLLRFAVGGSVLLLLLLLLVLRSLDKAVRHHHRHFRLLLIVVAVVVGGDVGAVPGAVQPLPHLVLVIANRAQDLGQGRRVFLLGVLEHEGEGLHAVLVVDDVLQEDLGLQVGRLSHLVPVGQKLSQLKF